MKHQLRLRGTFHRALYLFALLLFSALMTLAQEAPLKEGSIIFSSDKKNTTSTNTDFSGSINLSDKKISFTVPMANFLFEKPKQKDHYDGPKGVNIAEFVEAKYEGVIVTEEDLTAKGGHKVKVTGTLTVMGTTAELEAEGLIIVTTEGIEATSEFLLDRETFGITTTYGKMLDDQLKIVVSAKY